MLVQKGEQVRRDYGPWGFDALDSSPRFHAYYGRTPQRTERAPRKKMVGSGGREISDSSPVSLGLSISRWEKYEKKGEI